MAGNHQGDDDQGQAQEGGIDGFLQDDGPEHGNPGQGDENQQIANDPPQDDVDIQQPVAQNGDAGHHGEEDVADDAQGVDRQTGQGQQVGNGAQHGKGRADN